MKSGLSISLNEQGPDSEYTKKMAIQERIFNKWGKYTGDIKKWGALPIKFSGDEALYKIDLNKILGNNNRNLMNEQGTSQRNFINALGGRAGYLGVKASGDKFNVGVFDENNNNLLVPLGGMADTLDDAYSLLKSISEKYKTNIGGDTIASLGMSKGLSIK